jgi:hypothetical protein
MRRELSQWRAVADDPRRSFQERQEAAAKIEAIDDPRMTPVLREMWNRENDGRTNVGRGHLVKALQTIAEGGDQRAFVIVVHASIQDRQWDIRRDAAIWIGTRENRLDAIPIFVKYLRTPYYANAALTSLGYTQIPQNPQGPPDPDLVAALIDQLITVTPHRRQVVPLYGHIWHSQPASLGGVDSTRRAITHYYRGVVERVLVVEYIQEPNAEAKDLLYQYVYPYAAEEYRDQDLGYDQQLWRKAVLQPLRDQQRGSRKRPPQTPR